jgi:Spx/MgsR family transcriptional regulator
MLTIYAYDRCDTCRQALRWLDDRKIAHNTKAIRDTPPSLAELKRMLAAQGGDVRKLFNTSGVDYREQGIAKKLPELSQAEALALLAGNGNLVKRPFVTGDDHHLVGFKPEAWAEEFA